MFNYEAKVDGHFLTVNFNTDRAHHTEIIDLAAVQHYNADSDTPSIYGSLDKLVNWTQREIRCKRMTLDTICTFIADEIYDGLQIQNTLLGVNIISDYVIYNLAYKCCIPVDELKQNIALENRKEYERCCANSARRLAKLNKVGK